MCSSNAFLTQQNSITIDALDQAKIYFIPNEFWGQSLTENYKTKNKMSQYKVKDENLKLVIYKIEANFHYTCSAEDSRSLSQCDKSLKF